MRKADLFLLLKSRHTHQRPRRNRVISVLTPAAKTLLAMVSLALLLTVFWVGFSYARISSGLPSIEELPVLLDPANGELLQPTRLTDRSGQVTLTTLANPGVDRVYLSVNPDEPLHFSPQLVRAVVARLEPSFWQSPGYALDDLRDPQPHTIAERLASDLLLWNEPLSENRAVRMRILAAQLVRNYGRTRVLEWYLNSAYFGHLAFGAESASKLYLQKSAQDLTLAESALLAVLLDFPALNPIDAPGAILDTQHLFLAEMAQSGIVSTADFSSALREELEFRKSIASPESSAPSFTRMAIAQLENVMGQRRLERGGLVVQTTMDLSLQDEYDCAALAQLMVFENPSGSGVAYESTSCNAALLLPTQVFTGLDGRGLIAAGMVADPKNGQVLAYLSPVDYSGIFHTDPIYQPGTLISPFIAITGFTGGFSPSSLKWDIPATDSSQIEMINPDGIYHGPVSLRSAIVNDYLTPMVQLASQMDLSRVNQLTSALDLPLPDALTPADLYTSRFSANFLELATAYSALANSGTSTGAATPAGTIELNFSLKVLSVSNRLVLDRSTPAASPVLSEQLAYLINDVLSDNATRRDEYGYPNPFETGQITAVKIGQTADKSQVWTLGYTPERLVITWMGIPEPGSVKLQPEVSAGLWNAMMKTVTAGMANSGWVRPSGISELEVCVPSGMLPSLDCPETRKEIFLSGNEPVAADTLFEKIQVNRESGLRATVFTAPELIEEKIVMNVPASMRQWAIDNGYDVAPAGYDSIPYMTQNPNAQLVSPALFSTVGGKVTITGTAAGNNFAYYSLQFGKGINPGSWQQIAGEVATPVENGTLGEWDTTGLNGLYALRLLVVTTSNEVTQAVSQVTLDNIPPLITLTTPTADQQLQAVNNKVTLAAAITDSASVSKVEWWIDGKLAGSQTASPYAFQVTYAKGKHTVQLKAWDSAGNLAQSPTIEFSMLP